MYPLKNIERFFTAGENYGHNFGSSTFNRSVLNCSHSVDGKAGTFWKNPIELTLNHPENISYVS